jgi:CBS domain containing-hemolysin-like protein
LVEKIMRSPIKFSQGRSAVEVLRVMWGHQIYMAIIMGSHDKSAGIVTLEDILEEIVGEIDDEYENRKRTPAA